MKSFLSWILTDVISFILISVTSFIVSFVLSGKTFSDPDSIFHTVYLPQTVGIRTDLLKNITPLVEKSISAHHYPGAVILIGHRGQIIYRGVFGNRRVLPTKAPMLAETIFDLASLTKVLATTPAIMQLLEQGKLTLDDPVAKYWPAFGKYGKDKITIRELLTHESGLPADIPIHYSSKKGIYRQIEQLSLPSARNHIASGDNIISGNNIASGNIISGNNIASGNNIISGNNIASGNNIISENNIASKNKIYSRNKSFSPDKTFLYSDINFIVLAHLVEIISGESFEHYCKHHIFEPLGMKNTYFLPPKSLQNNIAPTEVSSSQILWGRPQDPLAQAMGGISGNAGLFSNAEDISLYLQCLLNGGRIGKTNHYLLGPLTILKMTTPQTPLNDVNVRGLGWDIDSPYSNRGILFPITSYGHSGWTGTSIWVDPTTQTYIIILTSRLHPKAAPHNPLIEDRRLIANFVAASITDVTHFTQSNTGLGELNRAYKE